MKLKLVAVAVLAQASATACLMASAPPRCAQVRMKAGDKQLVIWDCDGCLVDSEALLKTAEVEALSTAGFTDVTRDDCNRLFSGYAPEAGAARFLEEYGKPLPEDFFKDQIANSVSLFEDRLEQLNAKTVLALHAAGRRQVVASGSPRDRVLVCLQKAGIDHCFTPEQVFTREDVPGRGKVRSYCRGLHDPLRDRQHLYSAGVRVRTLILLTSCRAHVCVRS
jgi:phosphoglycolate phosphatase-like HAD superfamily hydrolase